MTFKLSAIFIAGCVVRSSAAAEQPADFLAELFAAPSTFFHSMLQGAGVSFLPENSAPMDVFLGGGGKTYGTVESVPADVTQRQIPFVNQDVIQRIPVVGPLTTAGWSVIEPLFRMPETIWPTLRAPMTAWQQSLQSMGSEGSAVYAPANPLQIFSFLPFPPPMNSAAKEAMLEGEDIQDLVKAYGPMIASMVDNAPMRNDVYDALEAVSAASPKVAQPSAGAAEVFVSEDVKGVMSSLLTYSPNWYADPDFNNLRGGSNQGLNERSNSPEKSAPGSEVRDSEVYVQVKDVVVGALPESPAQAVATAAVDEGVAMEIGKTLEEGGEYEPEVYVQVNDIVVQTLEVPPILAAAVALDEAADAVDEAQAVHDDLTSWRAEEILVPAVDPQATPGTSSVGEPMSSERNGSSIGDNPSSLREEEMVVRSAGVSVSMPDKPVLRTPVLLPVALPAAAVPVLEGGVPYVPPIRVAPSLVYPAENIDVPVAPQPYVVNGYTPSFEPYDVPVYANGELSGSPAVVAPQPSFVDPVYYPAGAPYLVETSYVDPYGGVTPYSVTVVDPAPVAEVVPLAPPVSSFVAASPTGFIDGVGVAQPADVVAPAAVVRPAELADPVDLVYPAELVAPLEVVDPIDVVQPLELVPAVEVVPTFTSFTTYDARPADTIIVDGVGYGGYPAAGSLVPSTWGMTGFRGEAVAEEMPPAIVEPSQQCWVKPSRPVPRFEVARDSFKSWVAHNVDEAQVLQVVHPENWYQKAPAYRSQLLPVPKRTAAGLPSADWRWIVDFRRLNAATLRAQDSSISIHRHRTVSHIMWASQQRFLTKVDLKDAFYSVPAHRLSRPLLHVMPRPDVARGRICWYAFTRLPMGVTDGPDIFSEYVEWILTHLPLQERSRVKIWLDDIMIAGASPEDCERLERRLAFLLRFFGLEMNREKRTPPADFEGGARLLGFKLVMGRRAGFAGEAVTAALETGSEGGAAAEAPAADAPRPAAFSDFPPPPYITLSDDLRAKTISVVDASLAELRRRPTRRLLDGALGTLRVLTVEEVARVLSHMQFAAFLCPHYGRWSAGLLSLSRRRQLRTLEHMARYCRLPETASFCAAGLRGAPSLHVVLNLFEGAGAEGAPRTVAVSARFAEFAQVGELARGRRRQPTPSPASATAPLPRLPHPPPLPLAAHWLSADVLLASFRGAPAHAFRRLLHNAVPFLTAWKAAATAPPASGAGSAPWSQFASVSPPSGCPPPHVYVQVVLRREDDLGVDEPLLRSALEAAMDDVVNGAPANPAAAAPRRAAVAGDAAAAAAAAMPPDIRISVRTRRTGGKTAHISPRGAEDGAKPPPRPRLLCAARPS